MMIVYKTAKIKKCYKINCIFYEFFLTVLDVISTQRLPPAPPQTFLGAQENNKNTVNNMVVVFIIILKLLHIF